LYSSSNMLGVVMVYRNIKPIHVRGASELEAGRNIPFLAKPATRQNPAFPAAQAHPPSQFFLGPPVYGLTEQESETPNFVCRCHGLRHTYTSTKK
jgi:hypothetical protein